MAYEHIPQNIAAGISSVTKNPIYVLMIINAFVLIVGFFMDLAASILILTPIFLPIAMSIGMDPVSFWYYVITKLIHWLGSSASQ